MHDRSLASAKLLVPLFAVALFALYPIQSKAQTGLIKTKGGFLAFAHSKDLAFTIHWNDDYGKIPEWLDYNRLDIFKSQFTMNFFDVQSILSDYPDIKNPLLALKKWETDYIEATMPSHIQRSPFFQDTIAMKLDHSAAVMVNRWFYSVEMMKGGNLYFYFFDICKGRTFIRFSFVGQLDDARMLTESIYSSLNFYPDKIDVELLQQSVMNGKFGY